LFSNRRHLIFRSILLSRNRARREPAATVSPQTSLPPPSSSYYPSSHPTESVEKQPSLHHQPSKKLGIQYISCELTSNNSNNTDTNSHHQLAPTTQQSIIPADNYSYVQLTAVHDYNYPLAEDPMTLRRDSTCSLKKRTTLDMPESIMKEGSMIKARLRCR
jgi:hypothetical protein